MIRMMAWFLLVALAACPANRPACAALQAGAAIVDVTPLTLPVLVNGGMTSRTADTVTTRVYARAVVVDDGHDRLAIVVVDSCMMPRPLLDEAKQLAAARTSIRPERILISATHTHTAPASMGCLGTNADPTYVPYLREKLAETIAEAESRLEPAEVGWGKADAAEYTALRRWIRRSDRIQEDPFGNLTVRANMHAGRNWDDVTGESGPEDPDLCLISWRALDGRPIAMLANFSMHYFSGQKALSADYFGLFCQGFEDWIKKTHPQGASNFVALMSHGCSGDIWRRDYTKPAAEQPDPSVESYTQGLLEIAQGAYGEIAYERDANLSMREMRMELRYRVPDLQRLEWARRVVTEMGNRLPETRPEVYAREQIILHERQTTEIVVQAIRIGSIGIVTTPNETYALTGLKLKLQSPLPQTMVIELANGGDGYIPPPEQHWLGGYNTWAARSAGLEVQAEPKITAAGLALLEQVADAPRRIYRQSQGPISKAILQAEPIAYYRLHEFGGTDAKDLSKWSRSARYEPGVAFFLEGPRSALFGLHGELNRAAHFAGGRLASRLSLAAPQYTVSLWFWNGMPNEARPTTGWMVSRGHNHVVTSPSEHLGLGGTAGNSGKLIYWDGSQLPPRAGHTTIARWTWHHVALVRDEASVRVYLDGKPEIDADGLYPLPSDMEEIFFGGRCDNQSNWEGRLDEIAVFDRVLSTDEIAVLAGQ